MQKIIRQGLCHAEWDQRRLPNGLKRCCRRSSMTTPMCEAEVQNRVFVLSDSTRRAVVQWVRAQKISNCIPPCEHVRFVDVLREWRGRHGVEGRNRSRLWHSGVEALGEAAATRSGDDPSGLCCPRSPKETKLAHVRNVFKETPACSRRQTQCAAVFFTVLLFCLSWQCVKANQVTGPVLDRQTKGSPPG